MLIYCIGGFFEVWLQWEINRPYGPADEVVVAVDLCLSLLQAWRSWIQYSWVPCIVVLYDGISIDCKGLLLVIANYTSAYDLLAWFDWFVEYSEA